jgi:serine/threonine-protein kinase
MNDDLEQILCSMQEDDLLDLLKKVSQERAPAVRHTLGTMAPELFGLSAWQSGDDDPDSVVTVHDVGPEGRQLTLDPSDSAPQATFSDDATSDVEARTSPEEPSVAPADRYETLKVLGEGGMGMVLRVRDTQLNRRVAMKVLKPRLLKSAAALGRFKEEAQIAAQLQHPGIIPVHDIGRRPDGSVYFTMKEVKGATYEDVIDDVQVALEDGHQRTQDGWTFRRVIDLFYRVCETVAYAHHRGVVHRDLKPENIMVGAFGEVLVLDWGLAKILAEEQTEAEELVETDRSLNNSIKTRMGSVAGTPSFMAPEQARGQIHKITPATDVYGLGGILYAILTGQTAYMASTVRQLLDMVSEGEPIVPAHAIKEPPGPVPKELSDIAMKALSFRAADRYAEAGAMAKEVAAWLDGARKREQALEIVSVANTHRDAIPRLLAQADALDAEAVRLLSQVPASAPLEARYPAWELEAQARQARKEADGLEMEVQQGLRSALTHAPDLPEAHDQLAERFFEAHQEAERVGDTRLARAMEVQLAAHDQRGRYSSYLQGDGSVTLVTDPAGAQVTLYEYVEQHKRLVPVFRRVLGTTPLVEVPLGRGSWMLKVTKEGHHDVTYPVLIERLQHWHGVPPGETEPFPIRLPKLGELGPEDCYVPAGWYWSGAEDPAQQHPLPRQRLWCHAMVFRKYPVTFGELAEACLDLHRQGKHEQARLIYPEDRGHPQLAYEDAVTIQPDFDGWKPGPRIPALLMTYAGVEAYVDWAVESTGLAWRLPHELEWEKAARGVDERSYPWGNQAESSLAGCLSAAPYSVEDHPCDVSVYGVRQLACGVVAWTRDPSPDGTLPVGSRIVKGPTRMAFNMLSRGGSWVDNLNSNRSTNRRAHPADLRAARVGFRLCRT